MAHVGQELALRGISLVRLGGQLDGPSDCQLELDIGLPQPLFRLLAGGDVDESRDEVVWIAALVADERHVDVGPDDGAVARDVALLEPSHSLLGGQFVLSGVADGPVIGMGEVAEPPAGEILG